MCYNSLKEGGLVQHVKMLRGHTSASRGHIYHTAEKGAWGMELVRGIAASAGLAVGTVRRLRHIQTGLGRVVMSPAQEYESFCAAAEAAPS